MISDNHPFLIDILLYPTKNLELYVLVLIPQIIVNMTIDDEDNF